MRVRRRMWSGRGGRGRVLRACRGSGCRDECARGVFGGAGVLGGESSTGPVCGAGGAFGEVGPGVEGGSDSPAYARAPESIRMRLGTSRTRGWRGGRTTRAGWRWRCGRVKRCLLASPTALEAAEWKAPEGCLRVSRTGEPVAGDGPGAARGRASLRAGDGGVRPGDKGGGRFLRHRATEGDGELDG